MSELAHPTGYDKRDIPVGRIALYALVGIIFLAFVAILGRSFFILAKERTYQRQVMEAPAPHLPQLEADWNERLTTYGVVDAEKGIYHIPIEVAMQQLAFEADR